MKNIVLIGMPASGKSTAGVLLAKSLGMPFVDIDLLIQQQEAMLLQHIIDTKGLAAFLEAEEKAVLNNTFEGSVIATGGSAIYSQAGMNKLKNSGTLIYLELPLKDIEKRLSNIKTRGVAIQKQQTINELYNERRPLYEKYADITLDCEGMDIEQVVSEIMLILK